MPGLLRGVARVAVVAGTATAVSNRVSRRQAGRWASQAPEPEPAPESAPPPPPPPAPVAPEPAAPAAGGMDDVLAQLKSLGELKEQGVLSEAEFEAQKQRILAG
ncbi:Short C-terminal domain-containing protein [Sanguibacter gelidistatuariae]|uniref:Short C-terminal domain-containing protein n=1 Tax=Sanguibacter gelidistatuariae TaxID=1814289 RepID=A0A1G6K5K3_9MICO|nr:SHOCT domain-containing protein [Sanguibacter gelidistatuariae]SDC25885.1 Short C-terminal domain-containing protein [Sanguibacter gelidistatuariae]